MTATHPAGGQSQSYKNSLIIPLPLNHWDSPATLLLHKGHQPDD